MATVKDYLKAQGYSKGDTITNPDNEAETYTVGSRGRAPRFLMKLAGVVNPSKSLKNAKRIAKAAKAAGKPSKGAKGAKATGSITLTNGTFYINGEMVYVGPEASIEVPAGAVVAGSLFTPAPAE